MNWSLLLEAGGWLCGIFIISIGVALGTGYWMKHTDFNTQLPSGHSPHCTCNYCMIQRGKRYERQVGKSRDREIEYPRTELYPMNSPIATTRALRLYDVVITRLPGKPTHRVYRVTNIVLKADHWMIYLEDQEDGTSLRLPIQEGLLDKPMWRRKM